jgi:hyperosmotically inducible periplasmic protein
MPHFKQTGIGLLTIGIVALAGCAQSDRYDRDTTRASTRGSYDANNTGRNVADRNSATTTPTDQSNDPADLAVTQKIRQALMDQSDLSMTAQNVKIVTVHGRVMLRGPVANATERAKIEMLAKSIAGTDNVTNELELESPQG